MINLANRRRVIAVVFEVLGQCHDSRMLGSKVCVIPSDSD
jgi:hypothetical protein